MGKSKIKQSAQYAYKDKKLKGKPGAGSMFIQLKSLKSLLGLKNGGDTMLQNSKKADLDKMANYLVMRKKEQKPSNQI